MIKSLAKNFVKKAISSAKQPVQSSTNRTHSSIYPEFSTERKQALIRIQEALRKNKEWKNDYVYITTNRHCPICSKYNHKVFSISGKSKKYPKLPISAIKNGGFCPNCTLGISSYFEDI